MAENEPKLHYVRSRKPGEPDFFDPQTDIRHILPELLSVVLARLEDEYANRPEAEDFKYLQASLRVFRIRILEDNTGVDAQVTEFLDAVAKVSDHARYLWCSRMLSAMLCIYALFCRRDSAADRDALTAMLNYTQATSFKELLPPDVYVGLLEQLRKAGVSLLVSNKTTAEGIAVCAETGDIIPRIKDIAAMFISASNADSWEKKAELCDREFSNPSIKSDHARIALALAYPTYKQQNMVVEVESDNETEKPAAP